MVELIEKPDPDELDKFGEYIALELRTICSDYIRRHLKNDIRKAIIKAMEQDEEILYQDTSSSVTSR